MKAELELAGLTGKIAALEMGQPGGRPVLAVHGWLDNAASFIPLAQFLPNYHWVSIDLPGHGRSQHRPDGAIYHLMDYVADISAVVDDLGWGEFDIVGHSLGAAIAGYFCAAFPEKVGRLVLIDGIGSMTDSEGEVLSRLRKAVAHLQSKRRSHSKPLKRNGYESWGSLIDSRLQAGKMHRENAKLLMERAAVECNGRVVVASDPRLKSPSFVYLSESQVSEILSGISSKTLFIQAQSGFAIGQSATLKRLAAIDEIEVVSLPGYHHLHMDEAESVAAQMAGFFSGVR